MCIEANRDMGHDDMMAALGRHYSKFTPIVLRTFRLPNGTRPDLLLLNQTGSAVIEVKTELRHSTIASVLKKYDRYCNWLYVAFPAGLPLPLWACQDYSAFTDKARWVGLIEVDWLTITVRRHATWKLCEPPIDDPTALVTALQAQKLAEG